MSQVKINELVCPKCAHKMPHDGLPLKDGRIVCSRCYTVIDFDPLIPKRERWRILENVGALQDTPAESLEEPDSTLPEGNEAFDHGVTEESRLLITESPVASHPCCLRCRSTCASSCTQLTNGTYLCSRCRDELALVSNSPPGPPREPGGGGVAAMSVVLGLIVGIGGLLSLHVPALIWACVLAIGVPFFISFLSGNDYPEALEAYKRKRADWDSAIAKRKPVYDFWPDYPPDWNERKQAAKQRAGYQCVQCGCGGTRKNPLQAHHHVKLRKGGSNRPENLITLCLKCHRKQPGHHHL